MPQIYDMGPTALLPLRRKAYWGFFRPKIRRFRPDLNPQTWVLKASTLPLDHRSRYYRLNKQGQIQRPLMASEIALRPFYTVICVFLIGNYWTSIKQTARKKFIDRISYNPSRNYGIGGRFKMLPESLNSDKYEIIQSCKLHLLQNSLPMPLYTSASDGKDVENISGSHFVNVFSALPSHSQWRL